MLRDLVGVQQYHMTAEIQKHLTAQINRIGTALEYLEKGPLTKVVYTGKEESYTPMPAGSLKKQWDDYIDKKYDKAIKTLGDAMTEIATRLSAKKAGAAASGTTIPDRTSSAKNTPGKLKTGMTKRGAGDPNSKYCSKEPNNAAMGMRIDMVLAEYNAVKGKWTKPAKPTPEATTP